MKTLKKIISLLTVCGLSVVPLLTTIKSHTFQPTVLLTNNNEMVKNTTSSYATTSQTMLRKLDDVIKDEMVALKLEEPIFDLGNYKFQQWTVSQTAYTGFFGQQSFSGEYDRRILTEAKNKGNIVNKIHLMNDGKETNTLTFNWSDGNFGKMVKTRGLIDIPSFKIVYPHMEYSDFKDHIITWPTVTVPNINMNILGELNKKESNMDVIDYGSWSKGKSTFDTAQIEQKIADTFWQLSADTWSGSWNWEYPKDGGRSRYFHTNGFGETFWEAMWYLGTSHGYRVFTKPIGMFQNNFEKTNVYAINLEQSVFQNLFGIDWETLNKHKTDNEKIWSAPTMKKMTENIMNFSNNFTYLKTIAYVVDILNQINEQIIYPSNKERFDFRTAIQNILINNDIQGIKNALRKNIFETDKWQKYIWPSNCRLNVEALINRIMTLSFPDYDELLSKANKLLYSGNHEFVDFSQGVGTFLENNFSKLEQAFFNKMLNNTTIYDWYDLYQCALAGLKSYSLVCNVYVNEANPEIVNDYDSEGNAQVREITIWDGNQCNFNYDFINDIGKDFINRNYLQFKLVNFRLIPSKFNTKTNSIYTKENVDPTILNIKAKDPWVRLMYRYNAVPIDRLILSSQYDPKWFKYFNIKTNRTINELVYLDNGKQSHWDNVIGQEVVDYQWYVNDLVPYVKDDPFTGIAGNPINGVDYNVRAIIKQNLNDSLGGYVMNTPGYGKDYKLFDKVISGIGVGDLNRFFNFKDELYFFDDVSWKTALNLLDIKFDSKYGRYPIFASSFENNMLYAIVTIPNWYYEDGTHGDYEAVWGDIVNNDLKWQWIDGHWLLDHKFYTMAEIKPRTRRNNQFVPKGWDNNGYFLVKMNVGDRAGNWNPSLKYPEKFNVNNWDNIQDQLIAPANLNAPLPFENAGILQLVLAKNQNGDYKYWVNTLKKVTENSFFKEVTYELNNWHLDYVQLLNDLNLNSLIEDKSVNFMKDIRNWIRYSNKYSKKEIDYLIGLTNAADNSQIKASALGWYIEHCLLNVEILNYQIVNFADLKYDKLFSSLLNFYGFKWEDVFIKKPVYVVNEKTNSYNLVLNKENFQNGFSNQQFTPYTKMVRLKNNNFVLANIKHDKDATTGLYTVNIKIPALILRELIINHHMTIPWAWEDNNYDPYHQSEKAWMLTNGRTAIEAIYGLTQNIPVLENYEMTNQGDYILVKQNVQESLNVMNIIYVSVIPLTIILLIIALIIILSWCKKGRRKSS